MTSTTAPSPSDAPAPLTHRKVWAIAGPIILSNTTVPLLGVVDTAVAGRLGAVYFIGAVAVGGTIFALLYWSFGFLRMGTAGLTAQAHGARNDREVQAALIRALLVSGLMGVVLIALQWPLAELMFPLMDASQEVEDWSRVYFSIRIWGAPAALANYALVGWFVGLGRTRMVLVLQLFQNGVNIVLSIALGLGAGWGVTGIAFGTLIAEWGTALLGLYVVWRMVRGQAHPDRAHILSREGLLKTFLINRDIMIRSVLLTIAFAWFIREGARIDDLTLAANQVLLQLFELTVYALDGFAFTAESLVGQAVGAGTVRAFDRATWLTSLWAGICALVGSLAFYLFGGLMIDAMAEQESVRAAARVYLPWAAIAPMIGIAAFQLDGIFIGATRGADMRNAMIQSFVIYVVALLVLKASFGNHGLWAALMVFFIARGITLWLYYPRLRASITA